MTWDTHCTCKSRNALHQNARARVSVVDVCQTKAIACVLFFFSFFFLARIRLESRSFAFDFFVFECTIDLLRCYRVSRRGGCLCVCVLAHVCASLFNTLTLTQRLRTQCNNCIVAAGRRLGASEEGRRGGRKAKSARRVRRPVCCLHIIHSSVCVCVCVTQTAQINTHTHELRIVVHHTHTH